MTFVNRLSVDDVGKPSDLRATPRFALLLRAAKLIGPRGEYLCIVRDVSETGVRLRLFHTLAGERRLALEGPSGEPIPMEMVWENEGEAGFRFDQPIEVLRFVAESGPYPKRQIRLAVDHPATLTVAGVIVEARLCDVSRQGAKIETDHHLAIGQRLRLTATHLPDFEATVCWRAQPTYGLVFHQLMGLEELAQRTHRIQTARGG
ncbi:PilZ domain-containing protein [Novosphingobium sp. Leaf2]|uniref:PilZ domain-containing protein n=1 Tax=Novosphingobium sp. Leaf2 TaxID=1735670 RepID=UPI0006FE136B|nr:PilZ domain-containing protein [Novosphingobium sp. Leaf2]KQM21915.1 pilus assembly protein PilZ [Novosphingobium sp. Leaf2]